MNKIFIFMIIFLIFSCSQTSLLNQMATNNIIPDQKTTPTVKSFDIENSIVIEWQSDPGADEYILYRAETPNGTYSEIYRGSQLKYIDNVAGYNIGKFFYYKLAKKRESQEFNRSNYAHGVRAESVKDLWEVNDSIETLKSMDGRNAITAKIHYYRDLKYGDIQEDLMDIDWYSLTIDPNKFVQFKVTFMNISKLEGIAGEDKLKVTSSYLPGTQVFTNEETFNLYNTTNEPKSLSFELFADKLDFLGADNTPGYKVITYWLSIVQIKPITY